MDMVDKDSRRLMVREILKKYNFSLTNERKKSDEFKTPGGRTIYFFWTQGVDVNIAIHPELPFDNLKSLPGVGFSRKNPLGIRGGTSMTDFPGEYRGFRPGNASSKVGRMFVIEYSSLSSFLNALADIHSGKESLPLAYDERKAPAIFHADVGPELSSDEIGNPDSSGMESVGFEHDPEIRRTVEQYAELVARKHYVSNGFRVQKFGKPFDLLCEKDGELIHVEVKGSRTKLNSVILTVNEVIDAKNAGWQSDLFIVDQIVVERKEGSLVASAGAARLIQKWSPAREMLTPLQFKYCLPDDGQWKHL